MVSVSRWWSERSRAERFDVSLRWPLYLVAASEPVVALLMVVGAAEPAARLRVAFFLLLSVLHGVVGLAVLHASIEAYLGSRRPRPLLIATLVALSVAGVLVAPDRAAGVMLMAGFLTGTLTPLLPLAALAGAVALGAALSGVLAGEAAALGYVFSIGLLVVTCRLSVWMLRLGWEIDRSREVSARLAVAEERLRFARDLHDALGRNLSLVAVQSELAARLAERGDDSAAGQMLDVRRIAHESLREMRAVVSGYRSTDLTTELAGAQSVLRSAGITCRVIGDGSTLPATTQTALGWVVREATTNVLRHSDATTCTIELDLTDEAVILRVANDGARAAGGPGETGNGLVGLRERLAGVTGTLQVEARAGGRFVLTARLPRRRHDPAADDAT